MNHITANDKLFLDLLLKGIDGKATPEENEQVKLALQAFVVKPKERFEQQKALIRDKLQAVSVSTDFAQMVTNAFNVIVEEDEYDMGWEAAFQDVPRDADKDFWEIGTITNGVTFKKIDEGERVDVYQVTGTKQNAYVDYYGSALGFTDKAIRFRKLAQMVVAARIFRNKFYANKADNHYQLLATAAAAATLVAWQVGATQLERDVLTINLAAITLGEACKDKGYGDTARAPLILYANPRDRARIEAAFRVTTAALAANGTTGGSEITDQPIRRIYTFNGNIVANHPFLVLPGWLNQKNEAMAPTTFVAPQDHLTLNRVQSVWAIYGAICGDSDQFVRFDLV